MINEKYVVIVDDSEEVWKLANKKLGKNDEYVLIKSDSATRSLKSAMLNMPDLVIINGDDLSSNDSLAVVEKVRSHSSITPIIYVSQETDKEHRVALLQNGMDFFIKKPLNEEYFSYTIQNISRLISANRCISGLTGLPGNVQIANEMQRRMSSHKLFAVLYMDLDNFKAYNDKYGFMNGDEVIKFTSESIQQAIKEKGTKGDFLGHIGGDDFVAIVDYENAKKVGKSVIKIFEKGIKEYYTEEDYEKGWIRVANRKGRLEKYPLITISVAMISNKYHSYTSTLEIGEDGAAVKKKAKTSQGSTFLEDRRKK